jgi:large subunit ribosomal protein L13
MSTTFPSAEQIKRRWYLLDADNAVLGRIATKAATLLMGKHKPGYTPFLDTGDHVVVINAAKVKLTGRKEDQKIYRRHSGYPGGLIEETARQRRARQPVKLVEDAIYGMLPKTKLGKQMYRKLRVYAGPQHPHQAQKPIPIPVAAD